MNYPQKRQVNVAAASKRKHDLSHFHIGTVDFGRMKPIECRYLLPGDDVKINLKNETRVLNAMPSPTIGRFDVVYRSFFVPIHVVWSNFYDFLKNQPSVIDGVEKSISTAPYISLKEFIEFFVTPDEESTEPVPEGGVAINDFCYAVVPSSPDAVNEYDFVVRADDDYLYICFHKQGRLINDFLTSLGFNVPWGVDVEDIEDVRLFWVLPIISFWKFYFDWIVPSRFIRQHEDYIGYFISNINRKSTDMKISISDFFKYTLHEPLAYYIDDFFTTSTEFPFQSSDELTDTYEISNPVPAADNVTGDYSPNSTVNGALTDSAGSFLFNMYTLQTLGKLQDLLNRNLIAGTKVQDWLLTEFGIKPNNDALQLSTYLGSKRTQLSVSDVLSNADTLSADGKTGTPLGAYGGYIRNDVELSFGYKAQEHGFYFITYELVPRTSYFQGLHAQFDMGDRFDFVQPEFDNQQGAPVPFRRLYFSQNKPDMLSRFDSKFGFQLQYADQKYSNDVVSGDFRTRSGLSLKSWYFARDMSYICDENNNIDGIDEEFCLVKSKYQNWHYIFSDMTDNLDPFLVAFYFNEPVMRPLKSVTEGFEPSYKNGNKEVTLDFSGSVK